MPLSLNGADWQLVYQANLAAQPSPIPTYFYPIPVITPPQLFTNILTIGAVSMSAKPTWRLAFFASAQINISGIGNVEIGNFFVRLGASVLDTKDSTPYRLQLHIPKWHREMTIEIYQYLGI